jgi:hypothetical protein
MMTMDNLSLVIDRCRAALGVPLGFGVVCAFLVVGVHFQMSLLLGVTFKAYQTHHSRQLRDARAKELQGLSMAFAVMDHHKSGALPLPVFAGLLRRLVGPGVTDRTVRVCFRLLGHMTALDSTAVEEGQLALENSRPVVQRRPGLLRGGKALGRQGSSKIVTVVDAVDFLDLNLVVTLARDATATGALDDEASTALGRSDRSGGSKSRRRDSFATAMRQFGGSTMYWGLCRALLAVDVLALLLDFECYPLLVWRSGAGAGAVDAPPALLPAADIEACVARAAAASWDKLVPSLSYNPPALTLTLNHVLTVLTLACLVPRIGGVGGVRHYWRVCGCARQLELVVVLGTAALMLAPGAMLLCHLLLAAGSGSFGTKHFAAFACAQSEGGGAALSPWLLFAPFPCASGLSALRLLRLPAYSARLGHFWASFFVAVPALLSTMTFSAMTMYMFAALSSEVLGARGLPRFATFASSFSAFMQLTFANDLAEILEEGQAAAGLLGVLFFLLYFIVAVSSLKEDGGCSICFLLRFLSSTGHSPPPPPNPPPALVRGPPCCYHLPARS